LPIPSVRLHGSSVWSEITIENYGATTTGGSSTLPPWCWLARVSWRRGPRISRPHGRRPIPRHDGWSRYCTRWLVDDPQPRKLGMKKLGMLPRCHSPKPCDATPSLIREHACRVAASAYGQVRAVAPRPRNAVVLRSRSKFVTPVTAKTDGCHIHHDPLCPRVTCAAPRQADTLGKRRNAGGWRYAVVSRMSRFAKTMQCELRGHQQTS
jgi:hypothetical protein